MLLEIKIKSLRSNHLKDSKERAAVNDKKSYHAHCSDGCQGAALAVISSIATHWDDKGEVISSRDFDTTIGATSNSERTRSVVNALGSGQRPTSAQSPRRNLIPLFFSTSNNFTVQYTRNTNMYDYTGASIGAEFIKEMKWRERKGRARSYPNFATDVLWHSTSAERRMLSWSRLAAFRICLAFSIQKWTSFIRPAILPFQASYGNKNEILIVFVFQVSESATRLEKFDFFSRSFGKGGLLSRLPTKNMCIFLAKLSRAQLISIQIQSRFKMAILRSNASDREPGTALFFLIFLHL